MGQFVCTITQSTMGTLIFNLTILDHSHWQSPGAQQIVLYVPHDWAVLAWWIVALATMTMVGVVTQCLFGCCMDSDSDKLTKLIKEAEKQTAALEQLCSRADALFHRR